MRPIKPKLTVATALLLWLAACGAATADTTTSAPTTPSDATSPPETTVAEPAWPTIHAAPADATLVWGTALCDFAEDGTDPDGGEGMAFECELDLSDERVTGRERHDRFRFHVGGMWIGNVWVVEDATLITPGGTWRGIAQAVEDRDAIPIGEAHHVGEGAYEGLEFHYYFFDHPDVEGAQIHGWIYSTP